LWKPQAHNVAWVDIIQFFNVFLHNIKIWWKSYLVSIYHNSLIVRVHEVNWDFRFDILKLSINIGNVCIWLYYNPFHIIWPHIYNNLFSREMFSCHVYFLFTFLAWFAYNIIDFRNIIKRKFGVVLGYLSI